MVRKNPLGETFHSGKWQACLHTLGFNENRKTLSDQRTGYIGLVPFKTRSGGSFSNWAAPGVFE